MLTRAYQITLTIFLISLYQFSYGLPLTDIHYDFNKGGELKNTGKQSGSNLKTAISPEAKINTNSIKFLDQVKDKTGMVRKGVLRQTRSYTGTYLTTGGTPDSTISGDTFTIAVWLLSKNPEKAKPYNAILCNGPQTDPAKSHFQIEMKQVYEFKVTGLQKKNGKGANKIANVEKNKWQHLVFVRNGNKHYFFIDGEFKTQYENDGSFIWREIRISTNRRGSSSSLCDMDDFRIYNQALNPAEVKTLYEKTKTSTLEPKTVAKVEYEQNKKRTPSTNSINWETNPKNVFMKSVKSKKPIFIFVHRAEVENAKRMEAETLKSKKIISLINKNFVSARVDFSNPSEFRYIRQWPLIRLPKVMIIEPSTEEFKLKDSVEGFLSINELEQFIKDNL